MPQQLGFGCIDARLRIYVANPPPLAEFAAFAQVTALVSGQIQHIGNQCGNGWRKVFNVYAKLALALPAPWQPNIQDCASWQLWRDRVLLQAGSNTSLLFSPPSLLPPPAASAQAPTLHLIAGRQHARALLASGDLTVPLQWLDDEFAINTTHRLIVCPYLDYRQLSDAKIARLAALTSQLSQ